MKFQIVEHRDGQVILEQKYASLFKEIIDVISGITDKDIQERHITKYGSRMSLSHSINSLLNERFIAKGWTSQAPIFQDQGTVQDKKWFLDFAKKDISIEVAFNHGEAIAWNLLKPVLASETNHVNKTIQTKVGVVICATKALKKAGAFDNAVGEFEKIRRYLKPLNTVLTVPMLIIGLEAPESFKVEKDRIGGRNVGRITEVIREALEKVKTI